MEMIDVLKKLEEIAQTRPELVADAVDNVSRTNPAEVQDNAVQTERVGGMSDIHIGAEEVVGEYADEDGNLKMPKADVLRAMAAEKEKASFPRSYEIETAMAMVNDKFGNDGIAKDDMDGQDESAVQEDTNDDLMQWAKKYSQYKNLEDDNLIEALYDFAFDLGITQFIFEVGELQAAEQKLGKKQEDWEDAEINAAMEMSPISNGLIDDLHRILPGNAELEQKLDSIRGQLEKAGLKEAGEEALEGNAFAQAVQQAKAAGMKKGDKFKVGDEEHTLRDSDFEGESTRDMTTEDKKQVNEAIQISTDSPQEASMMMQILKLAGVQQVDSAMINQEPEHGSDMDPGALNKQMDVPGDDAMGSMQMAKMRDMMTAPEEEKAEETFANSMGDEKEEPKYQDTDTLVNFHSGGLNSQKQQVRKEYPGDNPLAVKEDTISEEDVANSLRAQYEGFKAQYQEAAKPDFLDMDKDGDKKEPMKKAIKDKEAK
jgi:hypothetical protein